LLCACETSRLVKAKEKLRWLACLIVDDPEDPNSELIETPPPLVRQLSIEQAADRLYLIVKRLHRGCNWELLRHKISDGNEPLLAIEDFLFL